MTSFLEEIEQSFPAGLVLPDEFRRLFVWMETNGFVHKYDRSDRRYASLYPGELNRAKGGSLVAFHASDVCPAFVEAITLNNDPKTIAHVASRLAIFIRTGGDGSLAGIWKNDEGKQVFVHIGSGSGSVMLCTLADNPVDMLRLFAIGYYELCWPEEFADPPADDYDHGACLPPAQFRDWVESNFGVTIPATASEIITRTAEYGDENSHDPFTRWISNYSMED